MLNLELLEQELKKRWQFPYRWGRRQNNAWDKASNFIYQIQYFEDLLRHLEHHCPKDFDFAAFRDYGLNRWYNFWSARAVEHIFAQQAGVNAEANPYDRLRDFEIKGIHFDHKTSVFPKNYPYSLTYAQTHPADLARWLYAQQSGEQRQHFANRLFIILHKKDGKHWQLKAEITWLKRLVEDYVQNFKSDNLLRLHFYPNPHIAQSDIIWAIQ